MFNPVHHHCHPFTDFYKGLTCVEPRPFLTARKSDTPIFWRACLLVVPAGLDPRTYSIGTLQKVFGVMRIKPLIIYKFPTKFNYQTRNNNFVFNNSNVNCRVVANSFKSPTKTQTCQFRHSNPRFTVNNQMPTHKESTTTVVNIYSVHRTPIDKFTSNRYEFTSVRGPRLGCSQVG